MSTLVPTGRVFKEYEVLETKPIINTLPPTPQQSFCVLVVWLVVLGALGITGIVQYNGQNDYSMFYGIIFCIASGLSLIALVVSTVKHCKKINQPAVV